MGISGSPEVTARPTGIVRYTWLLWVLWLSFLIYPLNALFHAHPSALRLALVLPVAAIFAGIYAWNVWRNLRRVTSGLPANPPWLALGVMIAIGLTLTLADRRDWIELFIFIGVSMGPSVPAALAVRIVGAGVPVVVALGLATGAGIGPSAQIALQFAVSGFAVIIVVRTIALERELRTAREEIARLAVSEERLRFARDLHDLLGHSLSAITLKSELAGRLARAQPERATAEMRDVERVAREALREVREVVGGYRQPTLAAELSGARALLAAAGIVTDVETTERPLPAAIDAALAWTVREGATNIVRHSHAQHCWIRIRATPTVASGEVIDDGAADDTPAGQDGNGIAGLSERIAARGGVLTAGRDERGGFRLRVELPVRTTAGAAGT